MEEVMTVGNKSQEPMTIDQIRTLIYSNQFGFENKTYNGIDGTKIRVTVTLEICYFAPTNIKRNRLDKTKSFAKKCFVYRIVQYNNESIYKEKIIQEQVDKKDVLPTIYQYVSENQDGEYILSGIKDKTILCFDTSELKKNFISTITPSSVLESNTTQLIELDRAVEAFNRKDSDLAETILKRIISSPASENVMMKAKLYLGKVYREQKDFVSAKKYLEECLECNRQNYFAFLELGGIFSQLSMYDQAIAMFNLCEKCREHTYFVSHNIEAGRCYSRQQQLVRALGEFEEAVEVKPKNYYAHLERGEVLFLLGDYDQALSEATICERDFDFGFKHKILLGKIYYFTDRKNEALKVFYDLMNGNLTNDEKNKIPIEIGYFFHRNNDCVNAYNYYQKRDKFNTLYNLSDEEIRANLGNRFYIEPQKKYPNNSAFNVPIDLEKLQLIINNIVPVSTRPMFDVYQIAYSNVGYCALDPSHPNNYLTILTMSFDKRIVICYSDDILPGFQPQDVPAYFEVGKQKIHKHPNE